MLKKSCAVCMEGLLSQNTPRSKARRKSRRLVCIRRAAKRCTAKSKLRNGSTALHSSSLVSLGTSDNSFFRAGCSMLLTAMDSTMIVIVFLLSSCMFSSKNGGFILIFVDLPSPPTVAHGALARCGSPRPGPSSATKSGRLNNSSAQQHASSSHNTIALESQQLSPQLKSRLSLLPSPCTSTVTSSGKPVVAHDQLGQCGFLISTLCCCRCLCFS